MKCALWLNKKKIVSAEKIAENFDIAALRGYFLAGSLVPWLRENGGDSYANALAAVPSDASDLNERISAAFGKLPCLEESFPSASPAPAFQQASASNGSFVCSFKMPFGNSFVPASFVFGFGSYQLGSFRRFGSGMHEWEWEWFYKRGSFRRGSGGSYVLGSGFALTGSGSTLIFGSFGGFSSGTVFEELMTGSYHGFPVGSGNMPTSDEYDMIMYATLAKCPLNRFGYGIHNI